MANSSNTHRLAIVPRDWSIEQLPGLSLDDQTKLIGSGITTTQHLLRHTNSLSRKQTLSSQLQIHIQHIHKWSALADLAQVPAVGCQYCGLLLHAGVSSLVHLAQTSPQRLQRQILRFYVATLQRQDLCPTAGQLAEWVQQAQLLQSYGTSRRATVTR